MCLPLKSVCLGGWFSSNGAAKSSKCCFSTVDEHLTASDQGVQISSKEGDACGEDGTRHFELENVSHLSQNCKSAASVVLLMPSENGCSSGISRSSGKTSHESPRTRRVSLHASAPQGSSKSVSCHALCVEICITLQKVGCGAHLEQCARLRGVAAWSCPRAR